MKKEVLKKGVIELVILMPGGMILSAAALALFYAGNPNWPIAIFIAALIFTHAQTQRTIYGTNQLIENTNKLIESTNRLIKEVHEGLSMKLEGRSG